MILSLDANRKGRASNYNWNWRFKAWYLVQSHVTICIFLLVYYTYVQKSDVQWGLKDFLTQSKQRGKSGRTKAGGETCQRCDCHETLLPTFQSSMSPGHCSQWEASNYIFAVSMDQTRIVLKKHSNFRYLDWETFPPPTGLHKRANASCGGRPAGENFH